MSSVIAKYTQFDENGRCVGGGSLGLPDYLDWMPIDVKAFWFRHMGQGSELARYVLFSSQGEQRLLTTVSLRKLTHEEYKEKRDGAEQEVNRFIDEGGYSRTPRNQ